MLNRNELSSSGSSSEERHCPRVLVAERMQTASSDFVISNAG